MAKKDTFKPIEPDDDVDNPTLVAVPKTPEEVAKEGASLEKSEATGGVAPNPDEEPVGGERIWAMDQPHNVNERAEAGVDPNHPDAVEVR